MFRRTPKSDASTATPADEPANDPTHSGKGRPTPTRREAEAARKERVKPTLDKAAARRQLRERRAVESQKMREAMRTGDERYLPARDRGPERRFVRDFVDSRFCFAEVLLPFLLIIMLLQASAQKGLVGISNSLWLATIVLTVVDTVWCIFRLKRALRAQFGFDANMRGTTFYALTRMMQLRWLRLPKRQVGLGGRPITPKAKKS